MKHKLGVKDYRPLADFLPTLTIAAKNLATEMTNYSVKRQDKVITEQKSAHLPPPENHSYFILVLVV